MNVRDTPVQPIAGELGIDLFFLNILLYGVQSFFVCLFFVIRQLSCLFLFTFLLCVCVVVVVVVVATCTCYSNTVCR